MYSTDSILTSVCSAEVTTGGVLQRDESLSPRYTVSYTVHCYFNFRIIFSNFQLLSLSNFAIFLFLQYFTYLAKIYM